MVSASRKENRVRKPKGQWGPKVASSSPQAWGPGRDFLFFSSSFFSCPNPSHFLTMQRVTPPWGCALKPGEPSPRHDSRGCRNAKVRAPLFHVRLHALDIACHNVEAPFRPLPVNNKGKRATLQGIGQNIGLGDTVSSNSSANLLQHDESFCVDGRYPTSRIAFRLKHC